jgi:hypothetical protein
VFDVPCVGDDPPVFVLDLVRPRSEHLVDDERPLLEMATGRNPSGSAIPYPHPPTLTPTR